MARFLALSLCAVVLALAGCASTPPPPQAALPWLDDTFAYRPDLVQVHREDLFRLPADFQRQLEVAAAGDLPSMHRIRQVIALIFGPDGRGFAYTAAHSTVAEQTWANRRGDCLSLTILAYSASKALGLKPQMQEVQTRPTLDRLGRFDIMNAHVNVLFAGAYHAGFDLRSRLDVVVDFDPGLTVERRGIALDEDGILARYYNNVAVEHMIAGRRELAYAHLRAAISADPRYATPLANLAVLYRVAGRDAEAETLLRFALAHSARTDTPLRALHQLLVDQGRTAEAQPLERQIDANRREDPYYWTGVGVQHLQEGRISRAIDALERAREIAPNFPEIHRYLSVAYASVGQEKRAREELQIAVDLTGDQGPPGSKSTKFKKLQ